MTSKEEDRGQDFSAYAAIMDAANEVLHAAAKANDSVTVARAMRTKLLATQEWFPDIFKDDTDPDKIEI